MPTSVLVIDNDKVTRDVVEIVLHADGGYALMEAAGPDSALNILHAPPHRLVVVCDYHLPHMDGVAMLTLAEQVAWLSQRHAFVYETGASRGYSPPILLALLTRYAVPLEAKSSHLDDMLVDIWQAEQRLAQHPAYMRPPPTRTQ